MIKKELPFGQLKKIKSFCARDFSYGYDVVNNRKLPSEQVLKAGSWGLFEYDPGELSDEGKTRKISKKSTQKILDVLIESIESRLNADVPMCLFLSSGIDSSLIAAIIKLELNREIDTLTVSFDPNNKHSECNHANQVANYLGLNHTCLNVDSSNHNNIANEIIDLYGQPFDTLTALAIMDMSDAASKRYKGGITGFGGDEV